MRHGVRAVIVHEGRIVLLRQSKADATFFVFPGGGIEPGESAKEAVRRECREELGLEVRPDRFLMEYAQRLDGKDLSEQFFLCSVAGAAPERGEFEPVFVTRAEFASLDVRPVVAKEAVLGLEWQ